MVKKPVDGPEGFARGKANAEALIKRNGTGAEIEAWISNSKRTADDYARGVLLVLGRFDASRQA